MQVAPPVAPGQQVTDYQRALDEIEAKLIPNIDSEMTFASLHLCKQRPEEDLQAWHNRITTQWLRVHPTQDFTNAETDRYLICYFILGLACKKIREVMDRRLTSMTIALKITEDARGTQMLLEDEETPGGPQHTEPSGPGAMSRVRQTWALLQGLLLP